VLKLEKLLWPVFVLLVGSLIIKIIGNLFEIELEENIFWFRGIFFGLPVVLLLLML
jgi:hypothetical protein